MPQITRSHRTENPLVPIDMISHGTLNAIDMQASRRFYEEVLGFEVLQLSPVSLLLRRGSDHTYVVVETGEPGHMGVLAHNGLDVPDREAVEDAHRVLTEVKDEYGLRRINKLMEQHGVFSFYFQDLDANWWEITAGKPRGYSWAYDDGARDISDDTTVDVDLMEHVFDDDYADRRRARSGG